MKKYKIHVIQHSHTDLGYTHRQEYTYRSHARYLDNVMNIIDKNKDFKWTIENFWMFENYAKWSNPENVEKLKKYILDGKIEITGNYLNLLNIFDNKTFHNKVAKAKKTFPNIKVAMQQDVNAYDKKQALSLFDNGITNLYASIHTHHGMFIGEGKQRGFIWKLANGKKVTVWGGEHYMLGNEMFLHQETPNKYTFKDDVDSRTNSGFEQGLTRLNSYLDLLDNEKYPYKVLPIALSGTVIDNSPPNENIVDGVKKMNEAIGDRAELILSTLEDFFADINNEKLPEFTGEWPSWWVDGIISTPEAVRQYRESQLLYKNILEYNNHKGKLSTKKIQKLEGAMLMFAEHTWGSWSSQGNPFLNGNNLLLNRKIAMATKSSELAWELWDDIKENEGYNIVKIHEDNSYNVVNIHKNDISTIVSLEIPRNTFGKLDVDRYVNMEDAFEIIDEDGRVMPSALSPKMGLDDNINSSIESSLVILAKINIQKWQTKNIKIIRKNTAHLARTSSTRKIGVDNQDDIECDTAKYNCKYLRNGIESPYHTIKWGERGIYSIFDKTANKELLSNNKTIRPIRVISEGDSRTLFGRNRQGPSAKYSFGNLVSHKVVVNKDNIQVVKLIFDMEGAIRTELNMRVTSLSNDIRFEFVIHKNGSTWAENVYIDLPLINDSIHINKENYFFEAGKDQLPNSNLDYYEMYRGFVLNNKDFMIGINTQDNPLLQLGSIIYEQRKIFESPTTFIDSPKLWIMSNYWETNYKGTLEGTYSFAFNVSTSIDELKKIKDSWKKLISFKVWK